ncbi:DNA-directed RNA polymerase subunit beta [Alkalibacillus almallahensis]|uniref:DNA-directed RNA polymerase subunit beta n=1 Tax=Alkalibacillus almallahensis TaxID=1379154 RepID=UPI001FBA50BB|nr:DNA-directed RNA polymerase subunit beta [Alkalibacillus almallahensis]NIK11832.1 cobalamin biosynthesis Mg chelatase CobN [Alkalibacillus almallahensis]
MASEEKDQQQSRQIKGTKKYNPKPKQTNEDQHMKEDQTAKTDDQSNNQEKSQRKAAKEEKKKNKKKRKGRIRYLPVWVRFLLVIILAIVAAILGLVVGYGVVGEGEDPSSVLDPDLWQNMYDYIRGK